MYEYMAERLRDETKDMDLAIDALGKRLKTTAAAVEESALTLHQAAAQKTRAIALVHTLSRHLEAGRAQRRAKMARVEAELSEQEARLRAYDEREQRRMNMSMMPRVRCRKGEAGEEWCRRPLIAPARAMHPRHHCIARPVGAARNS